MWLSNGRALCIAYTICVTAFNSKSIWLWNHQLALNVLNAFQPNRCMCVCVCPPTNGVSLVYFSVSIDNDMCHASISHCFFCIQWWIVATATLPMRQILNMNVAVTYKWTLNALILNTVSEYAEHRASGKHIWITGVYRISLDIRWHGYLQNSVQWTQSSKSIVC